VKVRTVTGDVEAANLGPTYCHEHLIIDSALVAAEMPHIHLPSVDEAVAEVRTCTHVGTMVDAMPEGGRQLDRLVEVSQRTGVKVVSTTGLHTRKYYPTDHWALRDSAEELAARFETDLAERCGVIKFATGPEGLDGHALDVLTAIAATHQRTRAPILTHCGDGEGGLGQIEAMTALGVNITKVVLSHTDKVTDRGYHRALLETGVNLEYDQALRHFDDPNQPTAALLAEMIDSGFASQLMLGTDGARRSLWATLGGAPGLAYLNGEYRSILARHGIDELVQSQLLVTNPARWLAYLP
jgi:phosphotriesterase-related protein